MANAGLRTLLVYDILKKQTDAEHTLSVGALVELLARQGVQAERRAVNRDLDALEQFGVELVRSPKKDGGYYLARRDFDDAEVQVLIDAVQAARFIPAQQSRALVGKLMNLSSRHAQRELRREVFVDDRAKSTNAQLYDSIAALTQAIRKGRKVTFQYCSYNRYKKPVQRRGGEEYLVSPYALDWNNDAFYLIGQMGTLEKFTHFRVDRMQNVAVSDQPLLPYTAFYDQRELNIADYVKRTFSMFEGAAQWVDIRFDDSLMTAVVDKLGVDVMTVPDSDGSFVLHTRLVVGPGLSAWLAHFGGQARILAPQEACVQMREHLCAMLAQYD
ncbi:MAG: WYL domain-containing protein [Eubacteriales bacterium]|nr:WYL domain-containing protein [Eubacteriales bacterium]